MNEWINAVYSQVSNLSAILQQEQVKFWCDDDDIYFVLDHHTELVFFIVLLH